MTNRMNPGCCCGGCDLFRADFDLFCVVNEIPTTAADWVSGIDSGLSSSIVRRLSIAPGRPGEGLVYFQTQGLAPVQANKQRFIPEYSYHPAAAAIRALPDFSLYYYRIVDGYDIDDGYYILTPTSLSGPLTEEAANPAGRLEPDWHNYWRNHFRLFDGDGEVWGVVDPLPFVLQPDQYLETRRQLPAEWFSIDFRRLVYRTWNDTAGNAAELSLRADEDVISRLRFERGEATPSGLQTLARMFDGDDEAKALVPGPSSLASNLAMPYWWIHRAVHWDVSPWTDGREWQNVVDEINLWFTFFFWQRSFDFAQQELANVRVNRTPAAARSLLRISIEGEPQRLGTIAAQKDAAPRVTTWPRIDSLDRPGARDVNPSCGDRRSNELVYPYGQVEWQIREFSIEGMVSPEQFQFGASGRAIEFRHRQPPQPAFVAVADVPAFRVGPSDSSFVWVDSSRVVTNYAFESYDLDLQISPSGIGNDVNPASNIRSITAQLYEHDEQNVRLRIELSVDYFATDLVDEPGEFELTGIPLAALNYSSGLSGGAIGTFTATAEEFVVDPGLSTPDLDVGWVRRSGFGDEFNTIHIERRLITMQWDVILPKWEGDDYPEVEVTGAGYAWPSPSDQHIRVLRRIGFDLETGTSPFAGEFTVTGELVPIDLASVKIRIGFDPPPP